MWEFGIGNWGYFIIKWLFKRNFFPLFRFLLDCNYSPSKILVYFHSINCCLLQINSGFLNNGMSARKPPILYLIGIDGFSKQNKRFNLFGKWFISMSNSSNFFRMTHFIIFEFIRNKRKQEQKRKRKRKCSENYFKIFVSTTR